VVTVVMGLRTIFLYHSIMFAAFVLLHGGAYKIMANEGNRH